MYSFKSELKKLLSKFSYVYVNWIKLRRYVNVLTLLGAIRYFSVKKVDYLEISYLNNCLLVFQTKVISLNVTQAYNKISYVVCFKTLIKVIFASIAT